MSIITNYWKQLIKRLKNCWLRLKKKPVPLLIKQKAQEEGYEAGLKEGTRKAQQLFFDELQEVQRLKSEILGEREKLYYQFERDLVNLAMDIAKKVIYNRLHHDDEACRVKQR